MPKNPKSGTVGTPNAPLQAHLFPYQPYYCEENIWQLCGHEVLEGWERYAVFVSNPTRTVALWGQRAALEPEYPIVWDYHVIGLVREEVVSPWLVLDLDTEFGFPLDATLYLQQTFFGSEQWPELYLPMFRVIPAQEYRAVFSSDRSHMLDEVGQYKKTPPPWPSIQTTEGNNSLPSFITMTEDSVGRVMNLVEIQKFVL